jgi:hypothetical protein
VPPWAGGGRAWLPDQASPPRRAGRAGEPRAGARPYGALPPTSWDAVKPEGPKPAGACGGGLTGALLVGTTSPGPKVRTRHRAALHINERARWRRNSRHPVARFPKKRGDRARLRGGYVMHGANRDLRAPRCQATTLGAVVGVQWPMSLPMLVPGVLRSPDHPQPLCEARTPHRVSLTQRARPSGRRVRRLFQMVRPHSAHPSHRASACFGAIGSVADAFFGHGGLRLFVRS